MSTWEVCGASREFSVWNGKKENVGVCSER